MEWRRNNNDRKTKYNKEYNQKNKEKIAEYHKEYQERNRDKILLKKESIIRVISAGPR
jgi:hypothetical protein